MNPRNKIYPLAVLLLMYYSELSGQDNQTRISPIGLTQLSYKDSYVKITYGQPSKRKREIFGSLVPYNEVWRTGANEATEITITRDVNIMGKNVPSGTYSLFTIPTQTDWIIILNKEVALWGAYNYNPKQDLERWTVPVKKSTDKSYESLMIKLEGKNSQAGFDICWDDICVTLPIQFNEPKK